MSIGYILSIALFTFTMSITPGPNNLMLTASGVNFGFRRTVPHLLGIWAGFVLVLAVAAVGLGQVFDRYPGIKTAMKFAGALYMAFLAWKIARSGRSAGGERPGKPIGFFQAALFQVINPKTLMMALTVMTAYTLEGEAFAGSAMLAIGIFILTGFPATAAWALFGTAIGRKLESGRNLKVFNYVLAGLTVATAGMLAFG